MQTTAIKTTFVALTLAAPMGAAFARQGVITREAFACTSWAGAYAYTRASLTREGAKANKDLRHPLVRRDQGRDGGH
jgi:hypothetical protein